MTNTERIQANNNNLEECVDKANSLPSKKDVYNNGYQDGVEYGFNDGYTKGNGDGWSDGLTAGAENEQDRFWEVYQRSSGRTEYRNAFYGWLWKDSIYNPKYPIVCKSNSSEMFRYNTSITDTKVDIDFSNHTGTTSNVFNGASALKTIRKLIVNANVTYLTTGTSPTGWFDNCTALENITFEGVIGQSIDFSACPLTKASLLNIIEHLGTVSTTKTLTIGTTNQAKLAAEEIAKATQKGWSVA